MVRKLTGRTARHPHGQLSCVRVHVEAHLQAKDVHIFLKERNRLGAYPLFDRVYHICWDGHPVEKLTEGL
jgi:glycerol-3-phosphate dehydrogenase (NAD+)